MSSYSMSEWNYQSRKFDYRYFQSIEELEMAVRRFLKRGHTRDVMVYINGNRLRLKDECFKRLRPLHQHLLT